MALRCTSQLDPDRTDLAAVARQLAEAQQLAAAPGVVIPPLSAPADLRFTYEATAELEEATGWPLWVEAAVRCGVNGGYNKEYFIRLELLDPTP